MLAFLAVLSALVWFPILFYHIKIRAFVVLLIWLFIAPVTTNLINGHTNPFFRTSQETEQSSVVNASGRGKRKFTSSNIKIKELLEPTRTLLIVCFLVLLLDAVVKRNRMLPFDVTEVWMGVFSLIIVTNTLLLSMRPIFGLGVALDAFMVPFLAYYVTRRLVTSEEHFRLLVEVLGYLGLFIIICCIAERLTHSGLLFRIRGPFADVSLLFVVLITVFYAALEGTQTRPPILRRILLYLIPITLVFTWQRANWVGFLAGIWVFLFFGRRMINPSKKLGVIGVSLIAIPIMVIVIQALMPLVLTTGIETRVANSQNIDYRLKRWIVALQEGAKHPIFGIGINNTRELYFQVFGDYNSSHNSFVSFFAELGTIGLLAYLAVVGSIVRLGLRLYRRGAYLRDRWRGIVIVAVMVAYQTSALFYSSLFITDLSHIYIFIFVGAIAGLYGQHYARDGGNRRSKWVRVSFVLQRPARV